MNDARLGAFTALHFAGYQPHAAGAAVAGAAVMGQLDAVAQSSIQQQLAAGRQKALAIDGYLVMSCHCLILEGFFKYRSQTWSVLRRQSGEKSEIIWQERQVREFVSVIVLLGRGHMMALFRINTLSSILKSARTPFSRTM
jgi:hypothetical protein